MINIINKQDCCGCTACMQRCPKSCITMLEDEEGFFYPSVDNTSCINCGICEKVCPIINQDETRKPLIVYAGINTNEEQRLKSSSGGIFVLLAEQIIKEGGVVFGAHFNNNWEVEHCYVETLEHIEPLMRSKYVQSNINNTYKEAECFLKQKRKVLYVGTPCQISGLKKFLRKEYDNLIAVDFICHGVPSPGIWRKYLHQLNDFSSKKNCVSSFNVKEDIININFREKQLGGYSWRNFGFVINNNDETLVNSDFRKNNYMNAFLQNIILRPSCYSCKAKSGKSGSDITISDFWGIENIDNKFNDDKGVSMIIINTDKGMTLLSKQDSLSMNVVPTDLSLSQNIMYSESVREPKNRTAFFKNINNSNNILKALTNYTRTSYCQKLKHYIYRVLNHIRFK